MTDRITDRKSLNASLDRLLALDPALPKPVAPLPLRIRAASFESLVDIVVAQLISRAAAQAIMNRLHDAVDPLNAENWLVSNVSSAGLSSAKLQTLNGLALAIQRGELDLPSLAKAPAEEAIAALTAHKGIGPWTAHIFCLFCAGHLDTFPAGDVALQTAMARVLNLQTRPSAKEAAQLAKRWAPLRGVAARLLYAYYADMKGASATPL